MVGDEERVGLPPDVLTRLRATLESGRAAIAAHARETPPTRGLELAHAASDLVDGLVAALTAHALDRVESEEGAPSRAVAESVAIVAVGGYGRRELSPRSDVDVLFLVPDPPPPVGVDPIRTFVNTVLYGLWDLGLEVGHAVRGVAECLRIAAEDQSVKTGLLDARLLGRDRSAEAAFRELTVALDRQLLFGKGATDLIAQKLEEAERRRSRFGNSVYLLEPNVKASEGGLRELHTALWVARARWHAEGAGDLLRLSILTPREARTLDRAYGFLLRVRFELHLAAGRRHDALGFDFQERIAETLGYRAKGDDPDRRNQGVERFMRAYYFHARQIRHLAQLIIERSTADDTRAPAPMSPAPGGFKTYNGMLTVSDRDQLERDPTAIVRLFRVSEEESLPIYSYTKDLIVAALGGIDRRVRRDPAVVQDFLAILEDPRGDGAILHAMHDLGVLRRIFPEVSRMTAKWQHSLYHVYTVDVHSLFVVQNLKRLRAGASSDEHPELSRLVSELPRPSVLYLAGFFHDIGKGWNKSDHSTRGARVAEVVGRRFEAAETASWTRADTEDLVWLVQHHLVMSDISQRRDTSDHDLIEAFASSVATVERLTMLYALTVADMKGTSPKVWSDWKGALLREVFEVTRAAGSLAKPASDGGPFPADALATRKKRIEAEILEAVRAHGPASTTPEIVRAFIAKAPERHLFSFPPKRMIRHVEMWREVSERGALALHVKPLRREGSTRLTIVCPDRQGLLALFAGTVAANRLQILSAQIFSLPALGREDRLALDVLYLKDETGEICEDPARWEAFRRDLSGVLAGEIEVRALIDQRLRGSSLKARPRPAVKTEIVVVDDASKTETVVDVFCQDRLGVLYTIAQALTDAGLAIRVAKISTQGDRVADGFYVSDAITGAKIEDPDRIEALRRDLRAAILVG